MSGDLRGKNAPANTSMIVSGDASGFYFYQKKAGTSSAGSSMRGYTNFKRLLS